MSLYASIARCLALVIFVSWNGKVARAMDSLSNDSDVQSIATIKQPTPTPAWIKPLPAISDSSNDGETPLIRWRDDQIHIANQLTRYFDIAFNITTREDAERTGTVNIAYMPAYQTVQIHHIRVRRNESTIDKLSDAFIRFLQREAQLEQGIYSGAKSISILVGDLRIGDILEVSYSIVGDNPVFGNKAQTSSIWDTPTRTGYRRLVLSHPQERHIQWRQFGLGAAIVPDIEKTGDRREIVFEELNLQPYRPELNTPSDFFDMRQIQFSEYRSWGEVAGWASGLFTLDSDSIAAVSESAQNVSVQTLTLLTSSGEVGSQGIIGVALLPLSRR
ncbi:MAG: DUF3857 domain-containing protein [Burkholderiaceae bacterium]